jgi:hypothetical protein
MAGGLLQIVASGAQDVYLTGNPQITFFKVVYRRHTNFSLESIQQFFRNENNLDFGKSTYSVIERKADLMSGAVLEITLPALEQVQMGTGGVESTRVNWVNGIGNAILKTVQVKIGGYTVDTQSGEWMDINSQYNVTQDKRGAYDEMLGYRHTDITILAKDELTLHIPLNFWFNNPGLALPIEALQYHDVEIYFNFANLADMIVSDVPITNPIIKDTLNTTAKFLDCKLYVDYIYLDTDEKRRIIQSSHEYLIEQVQMLNYEEIRTGDTSKKIDLFLKHPVKSLYWVISNDEYTTTGSVAPNNQPLEYDANNGIDNKDTFKTMKLLFNGSDRFTDRPAKYFRLTQPFQYFKCCPDKYIYSYTFALRPYDLQPSGSCNFSRIDNVKMNMTFNAETQTLTPSKLKVYAVNYNVLRVMNGMSSIVFS